MNKQHNDIIRLIQGSFENGFARVPSSFLPVARQLSAREDRSFGRGMIAGAAIAAFVVMVIGLGIFYCYEASIAKPPLDYLPPVPGIVIDTTADIPDSIRQASPQTQHLYDSERVERRSEP